MTDYRDQKACVNCKFVVEEEYREYVCGKEPHPRPNSNDFKGRVNSREAWHDEKLLWEVCYAVKPKGICDDYETNE